MDEWSHARNGRRAAPLLVVQARTGSQRLPRKVLADLCGRPLLERLLARVAGPRSTSGVLVATTTEPGDDAVEALCDELGVAVLRGHPTDVLTRFVGVLDATGADAVVRVSADSPFLDAGTVDAVVEAFAGADADLAQNHRSGRWPYGTAVEVMTAECLRRIDRETQDPDVREHVTLHAYADGSGYRIVDVVPPAEVEAPELRLSVDTPEDLDRARSLWALFAPRDDFTLAEVVAASRSRVRA